MFSNSLHWPETFCIYIWGAIRTKSYTKNNQNSFSLWLWAEKDLSMEKVCFDYFLILTFFIFWQCEIGKTFAYCAFCKRDTKTLYTKHNISKMPTKIRKFEGSIYLFWTSYSLKYCFCHLFSCEFWINMWLMSWICTIEHKEMTIQKYIIVKWVIYLCFQFIFRYYFNSIIISFAPYNLFMSIVHTECTLYIQIYCNINSRQIY